MNHLKVALLTISPHNRAILEFFFAGAGKNLFEMASLEEAEAFVLDYDHTGAQEEWARISQKHAKPCIVLSVKEVQLDNTVWVSKPLTSKALTQAAHQISQFVVRESNTHAHSTTTQSFHPPEPTPSLPAFGIKVRTRGKTPPPAPTPAKMPSSTGKPMVAEQKTTITPSKVNRLMVSKPAIDQVIQDDIDPKEQNQRWEMLCSKRVDTSVATMQQDAAVFVSDEYLIKYIMEAYQLACDSMKSVQLKIGTQHYIMFMPNQHRAYSTIGLYSEQFAHLCSISISPQQVQIYTPSFTEAELIEQQTTEKPQFLYDIEAIIWSSMLLTGKGRLSHTTSPEQSYRLKHWPNLTRLEQIPYIMRIAATWNQYSGSAFHIAQRLNIPQRYVFSFHNAANALGLFELNQQTTLNQTQTAPKKHRGLFSRLLKRLLGGGAK